MVEAIEGHGFFLRVCPRCGMAWDGRRSNLARKEWDAATTHAGWELRRVGSHRIEIDVRSHACGGLMIDEGRVLEIVKETPWQIKPTTTQASGGAMSTKSAPG
jgi:Zn-finger nucleic acid-binding protein